MQETSLENSTKINSNDKTAYQTELLVNRLIKRYKHLRKWAKRTDVTCYRLYDRDIPEIPLAVDLYETESSYPGEDGIKYLQIALYERPYEKPETEENAWLNSMAHGASYALTIPETNIIIKTRKHQRGESQYEKLADKKTEFVVREQNERLLINLSDYLDTGLFFDHRILRSEIRKQSTGKNVLNLFCYTGSFSVYAASGKALSVESVDLSSKYLSWAEKNMNLNGFSDKLKYTYIECDVLTYLKQPSCKTYDLIILDPPTFSNSKKTETTLDINRDWSELVNLCIDHLSTNGTLYFSTNSRRLSFDTTLVKGFVDDGSSSELPYSVTITDISEKTIPEDFRNTKIHRCWEIKRQ